MPLQTASFPQAKTPALPPGGDYTECHLAKFSSYSNIILSMIQN